MKYIGLLSDTHGFLHPSVSDFFVNTDEIWHAGDIGSYAVIRKLKEISPVKAVYGNIDGTDIRVEFKEYLNFKIEGVNVLMIHIGGYPGKYNSRIKQLIMETNPNLVITGHSHILKVMYDKSYNHLHINPGSAGKSGLHKQITMVRFRIDEENISDLEIFETNR